MPEPQADVPAQMELTHPGQVLAVLNLVAASRLTAFAWYAQDAGQAPDVRDRVALSRLSAEQMGHYDDVVRAVVAAGDRADGGPDETAHVYLGLLDGIGARTRPRDWWERLMRSFVAGGMIADFASLLAERLKEPHRRLAVAALARGDQEETVIAVLRPATDADPALAARLALWGRRVAGEALGVVQPTLAAMTASVARGSGGQELGELTAPALSAISTGHARRMERLGLTA